MDLSKPWSGLTGENCYWIDVGHVIPSLKQPSTTCWYERTYYPPSEIEGCRFNRLVWCSWAQPWLTNHNSCAFIRKPWAHSLQSCLSRMGSYRFIQPRAYVWLPSQLAFGYPSTSENDWNIWVKLDSIMPWYYSWPFFKLHFLRRCQEWNKR